jgi:hypothetical protein
MPARKTKVAKMPTTSKKDAKVEKQQYIDEEEEDTLVSMEPPRPVFETFTADIQLQEGLNIIRDLGGGKYEIVNLTAVDSNEFASEEIGRSIKSIPARLALINMSDGAWSTVKSKCHQAAMSASKHILPPSPVIYRCLSKLCTPYCTKANYCHLF